MKTIYCIVLYMLAIPFPLFAQNTQPTHFSVQMHSLGSAPEQHRRAIDAVVKLGVKQVRDELFWHDVEKTRDILEIPRRYLENLQYSHEQGIDTLIILDYTNALYDDGHAPHTDSGRKAFAAYAQFCARELKQLVRYFEVWNEPNVDGFWPPRKNPEDYVDLLEEVYPAVKRGNHDALVIGVSLSTFDMEYIQRVIELGALEYMDALSLHPYSSASPESSDMTSKIENIIDLMKQHGKEIPIWITEMGYPTNTGGGVTEFRQAILLARVYLLAYTLPQIATTFWYWLGPDGERDWWAEHRFGLLRQDWSTKRAFDVYQRLIDILKDAVYVKRLSGSADTFLLEFQKGDMLLYALWTADTIVHCSLQSVSNPLTVHFLSGEEMTLVPKDKEVRIDITGIPVFITSPSALDISETTAPVHLVMTGGEKLPRGRTIPVSKIIKNPSYESTHIRLRAFPGFDRASVTQTSPLELYINPRVNPGEISLMTELHDLTTRKPYGYLVHECRITEPLSVSLKPLAPLKGERSLFVELQNLTNDNLEGTMIVSATSDTVTLSPKRLEFNLAGYTKEYSVKINLADFSDITALYHFNVDINLSDGTILHQEFPRISWCSCTYTEEPIVVDGDLSEWGKDISPMRIDSRSNIVATFRGWKGHHDLNVRVYTAWDDNWFYLAAEVEDDSLHFPHSGIQIYKNDSLEIYFDTLHSQDQDDIQYNNDDYQYGISLSEGREIVWSWSQLNGASTVSRARIIRNPLSSQTLSGKKFSGYIVESAIPFSELKVLPHDGMQIGFNVAVNDNDQPDVINPFMQELQMSWTGTPNAFQNPTAFGDIFFIRDHEQGISYDNNCLYVDNEPFIPIGFWVFGVSSSSLEWLAQNEGINAIAYEIPWSVIEPEEEVFDEISLGRFIALLRLAYSNDLKVLLQFSAHYTPSWLESKYPELRMRAPDGSPATANFASLCFDNPVFRSKWFRTVKRLTEQVKDEPALIAYSIWNEPALTSEVCYCTSTATAFRERLRATHEESIDKLNAAWNTHYANFIEISPPSEDDTPTTQTGLWYEWRQFRQEAMRSFFLQNAQAIRSIDSHRPLTLKTIWMPLDSRYSAHSAMRYDYTLDTVDILGNDPYPHPLDSFINPWIADTLISTSKLHDVQRGAPVWWLEYNNAFWQQFGPIQPEALRSLTWQSLAHQIRGIFYFYYPLETFDPRMGDNGLAFVYADDFSPVPALEEIFDIAPQVQEMRTLFAQIEFESSGIALLLSNDTMLHQAGSGRPTAEFSSVADMLYRLQIPFDVVTEDNIREGHLTRYNLMIAAGVDNCSDEVLEEIRKFMENGGWFVAFAGFAQYDEMNKPRALPDFLGVDVTRRDVSPRILIPAYRVIYEAKYNDRNTRKDAVEVIRASHSVITLRKDFGNLKTGDVIRSGPIAGFEDTRPLDERTERLEVKPGAEILGVFLDESPALTCYNRCVYFAAECSWSDYMMADLIDEISRRAGIVRSAYAVFKDKPGMVVPHIDVRCGRFGSERLVFILNSHPTREYDGRPVNAKIGIRLPGEVYTLEGERVTTDIEDGYRIFSITLSNAEHRVYRVK